MALDLEPIILKLEASRGVSLPRSDTLYMVAGILEALVAEGFSSAGVADLGERFEEVATAVRTLRSEMLNEMRGLQADMQAVRRELQELQRPAPPPASPPAQKTLLQRLLYDD